MAFALTEEQSRAVHDRGGGLLVSAAAGSGKTRVLVERLLDQVTGEGADIDDFLVITYTRAAAAELRARIAQELSDRLAERPNDRHLRRQTTLVYKAQISTVHAFCAALLRESGHQIGLDPDFRLCDEGEGAVLMARVLGETLDRQYEDLDPEGDFAALVDTMAAGRDDSRLEQIVLDVFGRIQSHPDPAGWLADQSRLWELDGVTDAGDTPWGALLLADARRQGERCLELLLRALELTGRDSVLSQNYGPSLSQSIQGVRALLAADSWDGVYRALPVEFPAAGRKKGVEDLEAAERVKGLRTRCKKQMDKLFEDLGGDSGQLLADLALARPAVRGLMELTARFQEDYAREKARRGVLDFSDLEHLALRLLTQDGDGGPGPLARYWSGRFAEVMVDEYQDTNQVQNAIFTAVSDGGRKLFMVGDVKQSIYRFRLADPTIFLDKYRRFKPWDQAAEGEERTVVLTRNFRSRPEVLEGTNDLFRNIMSTEFGELDYTQDQALAPGAAFPPEGDWRVELDLEDLSFLGDQEDKNLLEARWAARRIRELLDGELMLTEGSGQRRAEPSDVLLLLRSPGAVLHHYIRALNEAGLPWSAEGGEDFFASTEINVALSLLQIVDNPRQDVALIAALRSPVYGFSGDQLALLRAEGEGDFYSAVVQAAGRGDQACRDFLTELEELRFGAGDRTCRQLIWHIYERTNLLGLFGAMDGGQERQGRLLTLYALAGRLEEAGCRSLFQFLLRLERMRQTGGLSLSAPGVGETGGAAVRPVPAAEPGRPPAACPLPSGAGGGPPGPGPGADGGVSHPGPQGGGPEAGAGDDGGGAASALCGHDPGQREADPLHPAAAGSGEAGEAGGGPVCSTLPHGVGAPAERGRLGAASRPGPARGVRPAEHGGAAGGVPGDSGARLGYSMGRWGGTGPDSGAEGPLRGSARRVGDGTGGAERGAGLALSVLPFLPDPLQAHRHPAQGAEPGPGDPGGGRPGGPSAPAALHPAAPVRGGGAGTHPGPAGHSPAPGHAVSPPGHGHPGAGSGGAGAPGVRRLPHPPAGGGGRSGTAVRVF